MANPIYQPLDATNGHIRLLVLYPAKELSAPILCELIYTRLPLDPTYDALSYRWGDEGTGYSISLNGEPFQVLENLDAALRRLRRSSKRRVIWIDAICINQKDTSERREQVSQMRNIYEQAVQVVVWLGDIGSGGTVAMASFANRNYSFSNQMRMWHMERKLGLAQSFKNKLAAMKARQYDAKEMENGEVAQILDRAWWQRVWIIQEIVLAKKAVVLCGPDEVPWDAIKTRMSSDGMYRLQGTNRNKPLRIVDGTVVEDIYSFPNTEHTILDDLQKKWRSGAWNETIYELLYRFRRFGCTDPRDRIYAFIGLATDIEDLDLSPDYVSSTAQVFLNAARAMIAAHKHLLLLNCKREFSPNTILYQQTQIYSLPDQARFFDPEAFVVDGPNKKPRKGWVKLPAGWERQQLGAHLKEDVQSGVHVKEGVQFYNHTTKTAHLVSPLSTQKIESPSTLRDLRTLPEGWLKQWDNFGRVDYVYSPKKPQINLSPDVEFRDLPSWAPNWACWSARDPEPFPSLFQNEERYWASGRARSVSFNPSQDPDARVLSLTGVLFDSIKTLGSAWCPEPENLPISRMGVKALREWEKMALADVENCPYEKLEGRYDAFWRTHIADYAGDGSASAGDKDYFDTWCDRVGWTPIHSGVPHHQAMNAMRLHLWNAGIEPRPSVRQVFSVEYARGLNDKYRNIRTRVYKASVNRAMFVTSKGFIGLAPWNADRGDLVCVLFGGSTPYLLRPVERSKQFKLVGEAYVYGIMGGELFTPEMGHARLREFEIV